MQCSVKISETQRPASQENWTKTVQELADSCLAWSCMILQLVKLPKREYNTPRLPLPALPDPKDPLDTCAQEVSEPDLSMLSGHLFHQTLFFTSRGSFSLSWNAEMRCNEMQWDAMSTCQYTSIHFNNFESLLCYVSFSLLQKHFHGLSHDFPRRRTWDKSTTLHNSRIILWGASCHALHIIWQYFTC